MPLYEYRCPQCGPFDVRRTLEEASTPLSCPTCDRAGPARLHPSRYGEPEPARFPAPAPQTDAGSTGRSPVSRS